MVAGHDEQRIGGVRNKRGERNCGRCIARERLEDQRGGRAAQLPFDQVGMAGIGDDQRFGKARAFPGAVKRELEHRPFAGERKKLFGLILARHRPQAGARSARENDGDNACFFVHD